MFHKFWKKVFAEQVALAQEIIRQTVVENAANVIRLNNKGQYIIVVGDDDTARALAEHIGDHIDLSNGPRIVVTSAKNVNLIELLKE